MVKHEPLSSMSYGGVKRRGLSVRLGIYVPYGGEQIGEAGSALPLQVHSRAASKITNAPGMTTANTNSKNGEREVMPKRLFRHCRLFWWPRRARTFDWRDLNGRTTPGRDRAEHG